MVIVIDRRILRSCRLERPSHEKVKPFLRRRRKGERGQMDLVWKGGFGGGDPLVIQKEMRHDRNYPFTDPWSGSTHYRP